jgi:cell division septal protein FtsQ
MSGEASVPARFLVEKGAAARQALAADRRSKWRALGLAALRTTLAMGLSAAVVMGAFEGSEWTARSPLFDARAVRVRGRVHASQDELLLRSGLKPGQNLFRADLAAAARGVESSPWVVAASVSRSYPPAFDVEVVEHVPAARAQLGRIYLVDLQGRVFKRLDDEDAEDLQALPLVTGIPRAEWEEKRAEASPKLQGALQLVEAWLTEGLERDLLLEVRADEAASYTAFARTGDAVHELRVGAGPFRPKLRRYAQVRAALVRRGEKAARIDLDNQARPEWVAAQLTTDKDTAAQRP